MNCVIFLIILCIKYFEVYICINIYISFVILSYYKFWIFWMGVNTTFTIWELHIVNFVFTSTQLIQNLQYDNISNFFNMFL